MPLLSGWKGFAGGFGLILLGVSQAIDGVVKGQGISPDAISNIALGLGVVGIRHKQGGSDA